MVMVDVLAAYTFLSGLVWLFSILFSFKSRPDLLGFGTGVGIAAAVNLLARNFIWALAQSLV